MHRDAATKVTGSQAGKGVKAKPAVNSWRLECVCTSVGSGK